MRSIASKVLLLVVPAAIALGTPDVARAQVVTVTVDVEPPAAYIATATPEYYEGRQVYWYHDNWYYRDRHHHWVYYRSEPKYLRERRSHWGHGHDRDRDRDRDHDRDRGERDHRRESHRDHRR